MHHQSSSRKEENSRKSLTSATSKSVNNSSIDSADTAEHQSNKSCNGHTRVVWVSRGLFYAVLVAVAVILGFLSHHLLYEAEEETASVQYSSAVHHAMETAGSVASSKLLGSCALGKIVSTSAPDVEMWPFITVPGYYEISKVLQDMSIAGGFSVAPIVSPGEEAIAFENFAYDFLEQQFPNETVAVHDFGKGIWARECMDSEFEDGDCHDTTGETDYGSPYQILTPKFLHSKGNHRLLLLNVHHEIVKGSVIDAAIMCSEKRAVAENPSDINCQSVSEMDLAEDKAGAFIVTPIYPDGLTITGFVFSKINWDEILVGLFDDETSGIDIVVSTGKDEATYTVVNGDITFVGKGDLHDTSIEHSLNEMELLNAPFLAEKSVPYKLTFYQTEVFDDEYHTDTPIAAAIGSALIVLFTSLLFILYDFFVRREFNANKELLQAKRQFVRFISHEVRTPLNSVVMGLTLLQEEIGRALGFVSANDALEETSTSQSMGDTKSNTGNDSKDTDADDRAIVGEKRVSTWLQFSQEVQTNAQSSVDVLNDLLNYDKVESGTLSLELTIIDIWKLIAQTVQEFKLPIAKKQISLSLSMPDYNDNDEIRSQKVIGDAVRLSQVLRNLVSNAVKFTPQEGALHIVAEWVPDASRDASKPKTFQLKSADVVTHTCSGNLCLRVQDSGAGMTREQVARLFRQGVQFNVNDLQAGQGSGLGLFIAKGILEQHGGSLSAASEGLNKGTTFTVSIPLYEVQDHIVRAVTHGCDSSCSFNVYEKAPLNILIVDDAVSNRKLLGRLLENRGHTCTLAEDGQVALEKITESPYFDLILMDYEMPVLNGPETTKAIRSRGLDTFIVGITGNMLAEDVDFFRSCGANAVLPKPFKIEALEEICMEYGIQGKIAQ